MEAAQALPSVRSAALQMGGPLASVSQEGIIALPEREASQADKAAVILVSARYFETMGIPILRGRAIDTGDATNAPAVAVISESAARRFFGSANPVGRAFTNVQPGQGPARFDPTHAIEIVGIAHDLRYRNPRDPFEPILFLPITQAGLFTSPELVVRAAGNPLTLVGRSDGCWPTRPRVRPSQPFVC